MQMYYVYVLKSIDKGKLYVGYTKDLKRRYKEHNSGQVFSTKSMGILRLIFYEAFTKRGDALRREKYLKSTKGKRALKLMLKYSLS